MVTAMLESVTGHNQMFRAIKLTGSVTEKWMSYEVQPTNNQELGNMYWGDTKTSEGSKISNGILAHCL
jgi:hypothetical protein